MRPNLIVALAVLVQVAALVLAFRLPRLTGRRGLWLPWAGVAVALAVGAMVGLVTGAAAGLATTALAASLLLLAALWWLRRAPVAVNSQREPYRILFDQASDGIFLAGPDGRNVDVNPAGCELLGFRRRELVGRDLTALVPPEDLARQPIPWEQLRAGEAVRAQRRLRRRDGTLVPVEISARRLSDGRLLGLVRDISDRQRSEQALERSLSLLQATLESTADGILVVDRDRRVVSYNQKFAEMWRFPPDVPDAGDTRRLLTLVQDQLEDPDAFMRKLEVLHDDPEAESYDVLRCKDGRVFERYSQAQRIGGVSVGRVSSFRDVTDQKRADRVVRDSERRFRALVENSTDAIALLAETGEVCYVSSVIERVKGYTQEEYVGRDAFELIHPDDLVRVRENFQMCLAAPGTAVRVEYRSRHKDGSWRHMEAVGVSRLADPAVRAVVVNFRDVTYRKGAEDDLRRSRAFLAQSQEVARVGSWEWDVATNRVTWSDELYRIYGLEPQSVEITFESYLERVHPEDRARAREIVEHAYADKQPFDLEHRAQLTDGTIRWFHGRGRVVTDPDGNVIRMFGSSQDITERKRAEDALRRSEGEYRALVEHAPIGIFRAGAHGALVSVNPALVRILGYGSEDDLLGALLERDVFGDPEDWADMLQRHAASGYVSGVEVEWRRKDGVAIPVRLSGRVFRAPTGELASLEMIVEDVTERHALEAQLRQAQKMEAVGQLTGGIAHDFNNLLTVILANADIVERGLPAESQDLREDLADLRRAAQRGGDMVRKLLGFSRRGMLVLQPTNITSLVRDVLPMLRRVLPEHIDVRFTPRDTQATVRADQSAIEQILFNLATNARDAMPQGGTLRIQVARAWMTPAHPALQGWGAPGDYVRVRVRDTGHGMDEATKERIFDPFFTTKPPGLGTGLGMAMIYGLVKQQNGFIDVDSAPGDGTTVDLYFPLLPELMHVASNTTTTDESGGGSETILLVEDEPGIRRSAKRLLERRGYRVLLAGDGAEALDVFHEHEAEVDLIISDVVMPRVGGSQLYEKLRDSGKGVRFLFTSGYTARDFRDSGTLDPAIPFLAKPWTVDELLCKVRELLDER